MVNEIVQIRMERGDLEFIDFLVKAGICKTRSDGIRYLVSLGISSSKKLPQIIRVVEERDILPQLTRVASRFSDRSYHCWQSSDLHGRNFGSVPPYSVQSGIPDIYCGVHVPVHCEVTCIAVVYAV